MHDYSTPAVVLEMYVHGSLAICRTLGRLGVPIYGVHHDPRVPVFSSRYCRQQVRWNLSEAPAQQSVDFLLALGRQIGRRSILIPTSDEGVVFVAKNAAALRQWFLFPAQSPDLVEQLASKKHMFFLARRLGIPTAETSFPQTRQEVMDFAARAEFPLVLKGIHVNRLAQRTGKRMFIVRNAEELLHYYDICEDPAEPNLMLQEYIPGGEDSVWMFNGYFNARSECLVGITGKKIRQTPVYTGMTSLGICVGNETVYRQTVDFMKGVGYQGILDIGFRFDARKGSYKVLDVNPRVGATFRLFSDSTDMDVVRALYCDLTGQGVPPIALVEGRKWLLEDADLISSWKYYRDGNLSLRKWVRSFHGVEESAYFAWDDPLPFVKMLGQLAERGCSFAKRKLIPKLALRRRARLALST